MHGKLSRTWSESSWVRTVSPDLYDVPAAVSKIALSEEEQEVISRKVTSWSTRAWNSLFKRAQEEVVIPQVYKNLSDLEIRPPMWNDVKGLYYNAWVHKQNLLSEAKKVGDVLSHQGISFLFLKGLAVDSQYQGSWRAMADIDVLVKDFEPAQKSLSGIGYILDDMWTAEQGRFGVGNLYCRERKTKIDLHFGEYPVHSLGSFHLPVWERCRPGEPVTSLEDTLLVLAAHVFNHGFYLMRDINDVYVILQNELDWQYVTQNAKAYHLEKPLSMLLKAAASVYGVHINDVCKSRFSLLYQYGRRRHTFQGLLQLHHLVVLSHMKKLASYPGYWCASHLTTAHHVIDPPWIGRASPSWINRTDRKRLGDMSKEVFHSIFGGNTAAEQGMHFMCEQGGVYVEKRDLQEKDLERAKGIIRSSALKVDRDISI